MSAKDHGQREELKEEYVTYAVELLEADVLVHQRQQSNLTSVRQNKNLPKAATEQGCN